jgi:hypothetical protein
LKESQVKAQIKVHDCRHSNGGLIVSEQLRYQQILRASVRLTQVKGDVERHPSKSTGGAIGML